MPRELPEGWNDDPRLPKRGPVDHRVRNLAIAVVGLLVALLTLAIILPGLPAELRRQEQRETRTCESAQIKFYSVDPEAATLICARPSNGYGR